MTNKRVVVALGGNALQDPDRPPTSEEQLASAKHTAVSIVSLIKAGYEVIIAHGNGPQVGRIVLASEYAAEVTPVIPFPECGAMSQGYIGRDRARGSWAVVPSCLRSRRTYQFVAHEWPPGKDQSRYPSEPNHRNRDNWKRASSPERSQSARPCRETPMRHARELRSRTRIRIGIRGGDPTLPGPPRLPRPVVSVRSCRLGENPSA